MATVYHLQVKTLSPPLSSVWAQYSRYNNWLIGYNWSMYATVILYMFTKISQNRTTMIYSTRCIALLHYLIVADFDTAGLMVGLMECNTQPTKPLENNETMTPLPSLYGYTLANRGITATIIRMNPCRLSVEALTRAVNTCSPLKKSICVYSIRTQCSVHSSLWCARCKVGMVPLADSFPLYIPLLLPVSAALLHLMLSQCCDDKIMITQHNEMQYRVHIFTTGN